MKSDNLVKQSLIFAKIKFIHPPTLIFLVLLLLNKQHAVFANSKLLSFGGVKRSLLPKKERIAFSTNPLVCLETFRRKITRSNSSLNPQQLNASSRVGV